MRRILKIFLKVNRAGDTLYEGLEELVDDESGTIATLKKQVLYTCQDCGQPVEPNQVRINCPMCGGVCCDFCHEQQLKAEKSAFEREIILERERLRWLESKIFDNLPGINIIRQIKGINSLKKLERLESSQRKLSGR